MHTTSSPQVHKACILTNQHSMFSSDYKRTHGAVWEKKHTTQSQTGKNK